MIHSESRLQVDTLWLKNKNYGLKNAMKKMFSTFFIMFFICYGYLKYISSNINKIFLSNFCIIEFYKMTSHINGQINFVQLSLLHNKNVIQN